MDKYDFNAFDNEREQNPDELFEKNTANDSIGSSDSNGEHCEDTVGKQVFPSGVFFDQNGMPVMQKKPKKERDTYLSKVFFSMFWSWICGYVTIFVIQTIMFMVIPEMCDSSWVMMGMSSFNTVFTMLLFALFLPQRAKSKHPVTAKMNFKAVGRFFVISIGIMFVGAIIGNAVSYFLNSVFGFGMSNIVDDIVYDTEFLPMIISVVVFAPIFEELFFRKYLIDALNRYGTIFCCVISGLIFGIYHANFYQFYYAFGLGVLLAYIYCVYGKISYCIILHAVVNTIGSVVPLMIETLSETNEWIMICYGLICLTAVVCGICFLIKDMKWYRCYLVEGLYEKPFKRLLNPGFVALMILGGLLFVFCMV